MLRNVGFPLWYTWLVFWSFVNADSCRDEVTKHSNPLDSVIKLPNNDQQDQ